MAKRKPTKKLPTLSNDCEGEVKTGNTKRKHLEKGPY